MKLLIFPPFYPPHRGGLESHSDEFNKYLSQAGTSITVFTPHLPLEGLEREVCYNGVLVLRFPAFELIHNYPLPKFWSPKFWQLWGEISQGEYDLVLSRTRFFFTSLMAGYLAKRLRLPWVHIEHGSDFATFNGKLKTWLGQVYDWVFGAWILRTSDTVIANSHASARFVKQLSQRDDCTVIYRGIEKETIEQVAPHEFFEKHYPGKTVIGFVGRLIDGKGVFDLVQAFANLNTSTCLCAIIGSGPERARLEKFIAENRLTDKVVLFGEKPFAEAMSLLKSFDIFVNPSYTEGIPTSVIEAALCHKAIIATDVGGTREILSGTGDGCLIPPHDIEALQKNLRRLIEDAALRHAFGQSAYAAVKDKFSWDHATQQYLSLFASLKKF